MSTATTTVQDHVTTTAIADGTSAAAAPQPVAEAPAATAVGAATEAILAVVPDCRTNTQHTLHCNHRSVAAVNQRVTANHVQIDHIAA